MKYIEYLKYAMPKEREDWSQGLNNILMSSSLQIGVPHDENLNFLLLKYTKRRMLSQKSESEILGLNDLITNLPSCSANNKVEVYPLKNEFFSGDCVIMNDKIIGCAFIKRGRSFSKEGLWINGNKID